MNRTVIDIKHPGDDNEHVDEIHFSDGSIVTIIVQFGMIYVAECNYVDLCIRILTDENLESFEAYDTSDGCSYYRSSKYAEEVSDVLLRIVNCCGFCH